MTVAAVPRTQTKSGYRYLVVGVLAVVYTFNFLDRQILSILNEPIREELGLSDTELGLLSGLAFAMFYTTFGIPVAWLADRANRVRIIALACTIWSLCCAACGLATNFAQLAAGRVGVGIGEAGGAPPSYSLISDYFPPEERGKALALFSLGVPFGSMIGAAAGGWIAAAYGWRMAFFVVGLPGVILALLTLILVREPKRGGLDPTADGATAHQASPPLLSAIGAFFAERTLVLVALSSGLSAFVGYAMLSWNPAFLIRVKGMSLSEVAIYYSLVLGVTGIIGTLSAGWLADWLGKRDRRWYAWIPAVAFAISIPFLAAALYARSWQMALAFLSVPTLLKIMYLAPAIAVIQNSVPPGRRTVSSAILLFALNMIGLGGGPLFVGMISDFAKAQYGDQSLTIGLGALIPVIVLTVGAHIAAARSIGRDASKA
ncbi:spinster family MFS transporter [Phenylobacterium sp.]|uniref:spinster family MFS transporter n=1 Tax=Phenylobacterium sp. TaxID=1871053 RepID=UPI002FC8D0B3